LILVGPGAPARVEAFRVQAEILKKKRKKEK
jgi:hypothetical protein